MQALILASLLGLSSACVPPDCDRPDFGTCGTACCTVQFDFPKTSSTTLMSSLNASLAAGGPDGRFTLRSTAESPYGFGDLRPYHPGVVDFIGQSFHKTMKLTYTDTINYLISTTTPGRSSMKVFSISQIGGAYGDDGQNYKNIAVVIKALGIPYTEMNSTGCQAIRALPAR